MSTAALAPDGRDMTPTIARAASNAASLHRSRITSIDALRGLVMVIMLLDHVRETFYLHLQVTDPMTVASTPAAVFFSRFAAHFCAPTFVFLTGLSAWLYANPPSGVPRSVRGFLAKRGLLLLVLELTVIDFAWSGTFDVVWLQVMWAIGFSMLALAVLCGLPRTWLAAIGLMIVCGHNAFANIVVAPESPWYTLWTLMLHRGWLVSEGAMRVKLTYPALPWVGVILLGWCMGPVFAASVDSFVRRRKLILTGLACFTLLAILRGFNIYGENAAWIQGDTALQTAMSFINFTKYPPSLDFVLMTVGTALLMLGWFERIDNAVTRFFATYGGVPMFYYIVHLYALLASYRILLAISGPNQGARFGVDADSFWIVWVVWIGMVALMYLPVRAFGRYKRGSSQAWVKYF